MTSRSDIERMIEESYAARRQNDPVGALQYFADDCDFRIMGSHLLGPMAERISTRSILVSAIADLCATWDMAGVRRTGLWIDGDTAIIRHAGPIRHRPSGQVIDTALLDIITVTNGKITAYEQYADTQLIAHTLKTAAAAG